MGFSQGTADKVDQATAQVVTPEVANTLQSTAQANKALFQSLLSAFGNFGLPFNFGKATENPFANFLNTFLTTLKNTPSMTSSAAATSALDVVSHIVSNMDPAKDPINALIEQTHDMTTSMVGGVAEMLPEVIGMVGQMLFPVQSRSVESILGDVVNMLNGVISSITNVFINTLGLPAAVVNGAFSGVNAIVNNITNIRTEKGGLDGGFDIAEQAIGSASFIVQEINTTIHQLVEPVISTMSLQFANGINGVNDAMAAQINNALTNLANGAMRECAAPLSASMRAAGLGLNDAVVTCIRSEVDTLTGPLKTINVALESTSAVLVRTNQVLTSCFTWNFWDCGWNVS